MRTTRWSMLAALVAVLCLPVSISNAEARQFTTMPKAEVSPASNSSESDSSSDSSGSDETESSDSSDSDSDNEPGSISPDVTREALESQYENPADVAIPPKLLVPNKTGLKGVLEVQKFEVVQLHHRYGGHKLDRHLEPGLTSTRNQDTQLSSVPLDINTARISFKSPAQEFFDGATIGLAGLGSSALVLGSVVFFRTRRREQGDSN